ncbi:2,3-bisphosphoglycerate-independent phosphoglycerate mutase [Aminithiophilus ramosus]|uniref:2,3-bisphosphoglycerate-independent phosphoglycerate mutase n=2 Tax=Synergistales TaxID=649776 RepID=A0A9Q7AAM3_9BACT|nr:2,3-bisphosphoglycerate-independent phosphoglycerate mutase [Aminithiophilus ramosus]QTX33465.1 2,3-bisphosphoglycerate-independent phosphoglycerate mutase [Aminithiophilus ramosus]QVL36783.1 2,3-bisphosphoglycerate-independent phosphoglycerate mutase [Synergistota bacterium]
MTSRMELLSRLAVENQTKMVLLVVDGLGGLPGPRGLTELESARTPHLDELAARGETGLLEMVDLGITVGSGPGHLALFGYDPLEFSVGRGILEALGVGAAVGPGDICARGNFCRWGEREIVVDRRAGRLPTERSRQILERLGREIPEIDGVRVTCYPSQEHRFVVVFSGAGLDERVTDADPQKEDRPMRWATARAPEAEFTARTANAFIRRVAEVLEGDPQVSSCLLRGFSGVPLLPDLKSLYRIRSAALADYPMYRGLARLVGMNILESGPRYGDLFHAVQAYWDDYDFFYVHVKAPHLAGEDGDFVGKVRALEALDEELNLLTDLQPTVFVVTGDHSTPSLLKGHSWHPVPLLFFSPYGRPDDAVSFGERVCARGGLGKIEASKLMGLMLAHALRLMKYGA